nr:TIGR02206 family membrane protein [Salibacterium halotolerans]
MGPAHLMVFITLAVLCVLLITFRRRLRHTKADLFMRIFFPTVFLLGELSFQIFLITNGAWDVSHSLPLQLSSFVWMTAVLSFLTSGRIWFEITFFAGASSALLTLITPDLADYGFPHYRFFHFFLTHGLVIAAVCYMIVVEKRELYFSSIFRTWGVLNLYLVLVGFVNLLTGGNYMYIMEKPVQATPFDWLGPWPYYLLSLEAVALAVFFGMYYVYKKTIISCRSFRTKQKR